MTSSGDYKVLLIADRKEFPCLPLYFIINLHKLQLHLEAKHKLNTEQAGTAQSSVFLFFEPLKPGQMCHSSLCWQITEQMSSWKSSVHTQAPKAKGSQALKYCLNSNDCVLRITV